MKPDPDLIGVGVTDAAHLIVSVAVSGPSDVVSAETWIRAAEKH